LLWISMLISQIGNWMQLVANSWLLLQLTNSPFLLGLQGLFTSLPFIASSVFGGALADHVDRRKLVQITQVLLLAGAAVQGLLVQLGTIQFWQIYLFGSFNWAVGAIDMAGRQALLPALVPRSHLSSAIALNSSLRRGTGIFGPALGGIAIATLGLSGAYWANAASFAPVVLALALMNTVPDVKPDKPRSIGRSMLEGIGYANKQRLIGNLLCLEAVNSVFCNATPLMAVFARDVLHVGAQGLGTLLAMLGVGALAGAGLLVVAGQALVRGRFLLLATILNPIALICFALSRNYLLALGTLLLVGMFDMVGGALRNTAIQLEVHEGLRGRVMGLLSIAGRGVSPLGGVQSGAVASVLGAPVAVAIGGLVTMGWSVLTALRAKEIIRFDERAALVRAGAPAAAVAVRTA
jgi:MFS family permease